MNLPDISTVLRVTNKDKFLYQQVLFQGFQGFSKIPIQFQGFQGPITPFQGFQGF